MEVVFEQYRSLSETLGRDSGYIHLYIKDFEGSVACYSHSSIHSTFQCTGCVSCHCAHWTFYFSLYFSEKGPLNLLDLFGSQGWETWC